VRPDVVQATRSAFESGIDDAAAAALLDFVAGFREADRARELRKGIDELPRGWFETRILLRRECLPVRQSGFDRTGAQAGAQATGSAWLSGIPDVFKTGEVW
jgi:hypothetical protein